MIDPLEPGVYTTLVRESLREDIGAGDITTDAIVAPHLQARGVFLAKSRCVLAGLDVAAGVMRAVDPGIRFTAVKTDGDACHPGDEIARVDGSARSLLAAERTALNFLQHLSGIATLTRTFVDAAAGGITILDTRKTVPMLRSLEKYAVRCGGGRNHRVGLFDGILIKDNHIRVAGSVAEAVRRVRAADSGRPIEVEAQSLAEVEAALSAGADIIMLDNLSDALMIEAIAQIAGRAEIEISGGITIERIPHLASLGADYVSIGAITHSAPAADISLEIGVTAPADPVPEDLAVLLAAAADLGPFGAVHFHAEVDSTNDVALALAQAGAPAGTSVLAELQRAGRGRRGRDWFSPPGSGLYLSIVVRPAATATSPLTLAAGVAAARALHTVTALPIELKWPNDIVIGRPWRKLGGLLCETAGSGSTIEAVVIGIGINLRSVTYPRAISSRPTSIEAELGRPIDRAPLVVALLREVRAMVAAVDAGDYDQVRTEWRRFGQTALAGAPVTWTDPSGPRRGRARDIDIDGALIVDAGGRIERLIGGEVTWETVTRE